MNVLRRVSSTAQSAVAVDGEEREGLRFAVVREDAVVAMQNGEVLFTQKTSRQQAVTPRFGGRFVKDDGVLGVGREEDLVGDCDCSRTRTTSRGVTGFIVSCFSIVDLDHGLAVPRSDVRRLPDTAESIFCPAEISVSVSISLASSIVTGSLSSFLSIRPQTASCCLSNRKGSDMKPEIQRVFGL